MVKHKSLKEVMPEHQFILKSGEKIKSLNELADRLEDMADDVFYHHVNGTKNDFKSWINDIIKDKILTESLSNLLRKQDIITAIKGRINELERRKIKAAGAKAAKADMAKKAMAEKIIALRKKGEKTKAGKTKGAVMKAEKTKAEKIKPKAKKMAKIEIVKPFRRGEWIGNKMTDLAMEIADRVNEVEKTRQELARKTEFVSGINDFFLGLVIGLLLGIVLARVLM